MILRFYYHRGPHLLNGVFAGAQPVFAKLLPLRRDACKCQCARRACLPAAGRTYCRRRVRPGETCLLYPSPSLTLFFSCAIALFCTSFTCPFFVLVTVAAPLLD